MFLEFFLCVFVAEKELGKLFIRLSTGKDLRQCSSAI